MKFVPSFLFVVTLSGMIILPAFAVSVKENDADAQLQNQAAKARFLDARSEYFRARSVFDASRQQSRQDPSKTPQTFDAAKASLEKTTILVVAYLTSVRTRVQTVKGMEDSDRQALLSELDSDISYLNAKQSVISSTTEREPLISLAVGIRDYWRSSSARTERAMGLVVVARLATITQSFETVKGLVEEELKRRKESGSDVAEIEQLVQIFNSQLTTANEQGSSAAQVYRQLLTPDALESGRPNAKKATEDVKGGLRAADQSLLRIREKLRIAS